MTRFLVGALLGGSLILAACSSKPDLINYRGGDLKGDIKLERSSVVMSESGLPQAKAILKNTRSGASQFEYKIIWLDDNQMPIDEENRPWKSVNIQGKDSIAINATGPNNQAKHFQVQVRHPQGVTR